MISKVPPAETDNVYRSEMLEIIQEGINSENVRGRQVQLGPSEIGGCERKVAWKLAYGADGDAERDGGYAAHNGTLRHDWLDKVFKRTSRLMPDGSQRFYSDLKLDPVSPSINGGTLDLYDRLWARVVDWKVPGDGTMKKARSGNMARGYFVQAQTYGLHLEGMGFPVQSVALCFLPACGDDLHSLARGAAFRWWPYDREAAWAAIRNIERIRAMIDVAGAQKTMSVLPTMSDFCQSCPAWIGSGDRRAICPGSNAGNRAIDPSDPFSR